MGFYTQHVRASGVSVRASAAVAPGALEVAAARARRLLAGCPAIRDNLRAAGAELHVIGQHEAVSDLPMYRHLAGVPFDGDATIDQRGRGYGGLYACCAEESLLALPTARHADHRDICTHELAHTVLAFGLDDALQARVHARFAAARERWAGAYAATNADEFFAEATMWYVGSRGDYGRLPDPAPGPAWLRRFDPETFALLDAVWTGTLRPARLRWRALPRSAADRSRPSGPPTRLVFVNRTDRVVTTAWIDPGGRSHPYARIGAQGASLQPTYAGHLWEVAADGVPAARFVAGSTPRRGIVTRDDVGSPLRA